MLFLMWIGLNLEGICVNMIFYYLVGYMEVCRKNIFKNNY